MYGYKNTYSYNDYISGPAVPSFVRRNQRAASAARREADNREGVAVEVRVAAAPAEREERRGRETARDQRMSPPRERSGEDRPRALLPSQLVALCVALV